MTVHPYRPEMIGNPARDDLALTKQAELYIQKHAAEQEADREPARFHVALGILGVIFVAAALIGAVTG